MHRDHSIFFKRRIFILNRLLFTSLTTEESYIYVLVHIQINVIFSYVAYHFKLMKLPNCIHIAQVKHGLGWTQCEYVNSLITYHIHIIHMYYVIKVFAQLFSENNHGDFKRLCISNVMWSYNRRNNRSAPFTERYTGYVCTRGCQ